MFKRLKRNVLKIILNCIAILLEVTLESFPSSGAPHKERWLGQLSTPTPPHCHTLVSPHCHTSKFTPHFTALNPHLTTLLTVHSTTLPYCHTSSQYTQLSTLTPPHTLHSTLQTTFSSLIYLKRTKLSLNLSHNCFGHKLKICWSYKLRYVAGTGRVLALFWARE